MAKELLRFKLANAQVLELDPSELTYMRVAALEGEDNEYMLSIANSIAEFVIATGNFAECHDKLNKLHDKLGIQITDF